ncbi:MAG: Gfo/Idh/MocA family protein [Bryobacteraceae bacterium]
MAVKPRIAVVGLGSIGRRHARLLLARPDVAVEVVEPSAAALAFAQTQLGPLNAHTSFDAMLASAPEMVLIASPTNFHADQTVAALASGAHVFCEKPMSGNLADAVRMKQAADAAGRILNIGFHLHFCEGLVALKRVIAEGRLGTVLHAHMRVGTYITLVNSASRYQMRQEGSLMLDYSHQPDLLWWLFGAVPRTVYTAGFEGGNIELTSRPNVAAILCEYDTPFLATIHLNYLQMPERHEYEIVGDEGWAVFDFNRGLLRVGRRRDQSVAESLHGTEKDDMVRAEQQAFLDAAAGRRAPETSASDGLISTAICEAAVESWRARRPVEVQRPC